MALPILLNFKNVSPRLSSMAVGDDNGSVKAEKNHIGDPTMSFDFILGEPVLATIPSLSSRLNGALILSTRFYSNYGLPYELFLDSLSSFIIVQI